MQTGDRPDPLLRLCRSTGCIYRIQFRPFQQGCDEPVPESCLARVADKEVWVKVPVPCKQFFSGRCVKFSDNLLIRRIPFEDDHVTERGYRKDPALPDDPADVSNSSSFGILLLGLFKDGEVLPDGCKVLADIEVLLG